MSKGIAWLVAASVALAAQTSARRSDAPPADAAGQPRLSAGFGQVPLSFEVNQGQTDGRVRFLARGQGYSLFLTPAEAVLSLRTPTSKRAAVEHGVNTTTADGDAAPGAVVRMRLAGANTHPQLTGLDPQPGKSNYFIGDRPERWQRDVPNYGRVKYADVYPGIDLIYYGNQRQLEYDMVVGPAADPGRIALDFEGVDKLALDREGNLLLETAGGSIEQHKPVIYQDIDGTRRPVDGRYVLRATHRVGFQVVRYDTTRPLVIDPMLSYSSYLGGGSNDIGYAVAVDSAGSAYVTGLTRSTDFPGTATSPIQPTWLGSDDVFVTKLNAAGNALAYSTYLGGSGGEFGYAIAVDSTGNAYVTGATDSPTVPGPGNIAFPLAGPIDASYNGGGDVFITKINASGNALVYSTYLGGTGTDRGYGIAVDGSGDAYVTGSTSSGLSSTVPNAGDFPTAFPLQPLIASPGASDAFVTVINPAGNGLVYSTYLGGNGNEFSIDGGGIAIDADGNAYVGGTTTSSNFPGAGTSTIQPVYGGVVTGRSDGFVVKFNAAGSALLYSTYLGGATDDAVNGIAIDASRNAYVVGYTVSPDFPTAAALFGTKSGAAGGEDAFVAKINAAGSALLYSTFLGGTNGERAYAVAVDSHGNALVSGWTASAADFPKVTPVQAVGGNTDAFVSEFNVAGSALLHSTYLGGTNGSEHGYGIAVDRLHNDDVYVTGDTTSTNFPTAGSFQATFGGPGTDAFVSKIVNTAAVPVTITATATSPTSVTVTWTGSAGAASYEMLRHGGLGLDFFAPTVNQSFVDTFVVPGTAYLYRVRSVDGVSGARSIYSDPDLATTVMFTDDPLVVGGTVVKAIHITELRTAVSAVRVLAGVAPVTFTDAGLGSGSAIKRVHIEELRGGLSEARTFLVLPVVTFTDPVLTSGVSIVKAAHVQELRGGVK